MSYTGSSVTLDNGQFNWILSAERFWPKYLRELSMVRAEVKRNLGAVAGGDMLTRSRQFDINRARFDLPAGRLDGQELDLSQAYLTAAGVLGLLSPETVERVGRLRKAWRLRVLGAIATRRLIVRYSAAGDVLGRESKTDADLRRAWFCICGLVDRQLRVLQRRAGPRFLFYWYDNFYADAGALTPAILDCCTEFKYRIAPVGVAWSRTRHALQLDVDGRLFHFAA